MTTTIAGVKISENYRAALEYDKSDGFRAQLYYTSPNSTVVSTNASNVYGGITEKKARRRFYSQVKRWKEQVG